MNVEITKKATMWIRIQCLPIEFYNNIFLDMIGISLGKFLKVDKLTSIQSKGKFVRICVKLDLEKPLETHIYLHGFMLNLEYEGFYSICFRCGRVGHKREQCVELINSSTMEEESDSTGRMNLEKDTNISGEDATSVVADAKVHEEPRAGVNMSSKPLIIME